MSFAVVRCPACQGAAQVDPAALGLMVRCPRCDDTFTAIEEPEAPAPISPRVNRNPLLPPPEPPRPRRRKRRDRDRDRDRDRSPEPASEPQQFHDPEHDPHAAPTGPLPASVLIGLALLPFVIPILWLIAPAVIGQEPVLSIATPISLAIAASVLCLAVIYTIDWTPATRVKGVLMLVCLSYFAAVSLYFLKKEMVDRIQKATGLREGAEWPVFAAPAGDYQVRMPGRPVPANLPQDQPFAKIHPLTCYKSFHKMPFLGNYEFVVGSTPKHRPIVAARGDEPAPGTDEWFNSLSKEVVQQSGGTLHQSGPVTHQRCKGRELEIRLGESRIRFVRIYFIKDRVFYLSAEGVNLHPDEDPADAFFDSFFVPDAAN